MRREMTNHCVIAKNNVLAVCISYTSLNVRGANRQITLLALEKSAHKRMTARFNGPEIIMQTASHKAIVGVVSGFGYAQDTMIHTILNLILGITLCISMWDYLPLGVKCEVCSEPACIVNIIIRLTICISLPSFRSAM
jgi:hypothetical protein